MAYKRTVVRRPQGDLKHPYSHRRWRRLRAALYFLSKSAKRYVWWVDGIYLEERLEDQAQCILVIIGATPEPDFLHQPCAR